MEASHHQHGRAVEHLADSCMPSASDSERVAAKIEEALERANPRALQQELRELYQSSETSVEPWRVLSQALSLDTGRPSSEAGLKFWKMLKWCGPESVPPSPALRADAIQIYGSLASRDRDRLLSAAPKESAEPLLFALESLLSAGASGNPYQVELSRRKQAEIVQELPRVLDRLTLNDRSVRSALGKLSKLPVALLKDCVAVVRQSGGSKTSVRNRAAFLTSAFLYRNVSVSTPELEVMQECCDALCELRPRLRANLSRSLKARQNVDGAAETAIAVSLFSETGLDKEMGTLLRWDRREDQRHWGFSVSDHIRKALSVREYQKPLSPEEVSRTLGLSDKSDAVLAVLLSRDDYLEYRERVTREIGTGRVSYRMLCGLLGVFSVPQAAETQPLRERLLDQLKSPERSPHLTEWEHINLKARSLLGNRRMELEDRVDVLETLVSSVRGSRSLATRADGYRWISNVLFLRSDMNESVSPLPGFPTLFYEAQQRMLEAAIKPIDGCSRTRALASVLRGAPFMKPRKKRLQILSPLTDHITQLGIPLEAYFPRSKSQNDFSPLTEDSEGAEKVLPVHLDQMRRLENAVPGGCGLLYRTAGIRFFGRYPLALLVRQAERAEEFLRSGKPVGAGEEYLVGCFATHGNEYDEMIRVNWLENAAKNPRARAAGLPVYIMEVGSTAAMARRFTRFQQLVGVKPRTVVLSGHGSSLGLTLSAKREFGMTQLRRKGFPESAARLLAPKPQIVIDSCSNGVDGGFAEELERKLSALNAVVWSIPNEGGLWTLRARFGDQIEVNPIFLGSGAGYDLIPPKIARSH